MSLKNKNKEIERLKYYIEIFRNQQQLLNEKLHIACEALRDVRDWNEERLYVWDDPGDRANEALEKIKNISIRPW